MTWLLKLLFQHLNVLVGRITMLFLRLWDHAGVVHKHLLALRLISVLLLEHKIHNVILEELVMRVIHPNCSLKLAIATHNAHNLVFAGIGQPSGVQCFFARCNDNLVLHEDTSHFALLRWLSRSLGKFLLTTLLPAQSLLLSHLALLGYLCL